jgi:hypothetical protein
VSRNVGRVSPVGQGETEEKAERLRREAYLVGCLAAVHDVEAEHAAEDGAGHHPHVRPPPRTRRRHRSLSLVSHKLTLPPPPIEGGEETSGRCGGVGLRRRRGGPGRCFRRTGLA